MDARIAREKKDGKDFVRALAAKITGLSGDSLTPLYRRSLDILANHDRTWDESNELQLADNIRKMLVKHGKSKDAVTFDDLHRRLAACSIVKQRWAFLCLMYCLQEDVSAQNAKTPKMFVSSPQEVLKTNRMGVSTNMKASTPVILPCPQYSESQRLALNNNNNSMGSKTLVSSRVASYLSYSQSTPGTDKKAYELSVNRRDTLSKNFSNDIPENVLLREIIYIFQGIDGSIIRFDSGKEDVFVDPKAGVSRPVREMLLKLAELGWLFNKVRCYCDAHGSDKSFGLVGQSFAASLQQELLEYYRLLAVLESQLQQDDEQGLGSNNGGLSLRRLMVWTFEPISRLKILAALVDNCKGLKGGALASAIHSYLRHGDPFLRDLISSILAKVSVPIYTKLRHWIVDGELYDPFHEFFVAANPNIADDKLWHEKYSLRPQMVPSFLTTAQARKILSTGKSINFLRQVCRDRSPVKGKEAIKAMLDETTAESLFTQDLNGGLQRMIDLAFKETSTHVLNVMYNTYKFFDHLKAMRRYLLLGQGDFIRHLLDLLEPHLNKPASTLYLHNLTGILETAIRATNAQYDDPDILKRLDIRFLEVSPGDTGWDVFTLYYRMDGPIGTVFTPNVLLIYLRLFNSLWRAKRMEYVLSGMWKAQMAYSRMFKSMPELSPILHQCHILTDEMVHFIQQMQYYITFEVMECSWDVLETKVKSAEDLDQVIAAHEEFLETIMTRSLLDESSVDLLNQLRAIYDLIIQFQTIQDQFSELAQKELHTRQASQNAATDDSERALDLETEQKRQLEFSKSIISNIKAQLRILSVSFQDMVKKFLLMLTSHPDVSLQFLSFRLDFNEHYKKSDSRLHAPLTYQHRRMSSSSLSVI